MRRRRWLVNCCRLADGHGSTALTFIFQFTSIRLFFTLFLFLLTDCPSVVVGEVQIQRISDRVVPVPGGNVKGVIASITDEGPLKGRLVEQFYGIQYASVPERFLPPERPTDQWQGNRILWNPAPACPGPEYGGGVDDLRRAGYNRIARTRLEAVVAASKVFDSDMYDWESTCLKMNIFVPYENRTANPSLKPNPRAVLVFIPAESFEFGSANAYNPTPLVAYGDIIVVTLNIRHGALGFLASGDQSSSSASAPGNMALFDVVSALHWIRANIAQFGGDPHRITLLGQQHAAALVHLLMASPVVRGNRLFQRAILQGGSALSPYAIQSLAAAQSSMLALGLAAGCSEPLLRQVPVLMRCLRNKTVQHLTNVNMKQSGVEDGFLPLVSNFGPTITSGNLLSIDLQELNERRLPYDVLLGASAHSGADLIPEECLQLRGCNSTDRMRIIKSLVKLVFHESRRRIIDVLAHQYKDHRRPDAPDAIAAELTKLLGDSYVVAPLIKTANIQANKGRGNSVYFYVMDYGSSPIANASGLLPSSPTSFPGDELAYIFGSPLVSNLPPYAGRRFSPDERFISETMMTYWANFVKTGNPNTPSPKPSSYWWRSTQFREEVPWPVYTTESREFLRIGAQVEPDQRYKADMMALWLDLIPRLHSDGTPTSSPDSQPPLFPPPPPMPPPPLFMTEPANYDALSSATESPDFDMFTMSTVEFTTRIQPTFTFPPTQPSTPQGPPSSTRRYPGRKTDGMIVINPEDLPEGNSAERSSYVTPVALIETRSTTESADLSLNSWVPVVISGGVEEDGVSPKKPSYTVSTTAGHPHQTTNQSLFASLPMPLVVTVAIVSALIVGNLVICGVIYCVRRKRRKRQAALMESAESGGKSPLNGSKTPPPKGSVNGKLNGTSPAPVHKYRSLGKSSEEMRPLRSGEDGDGPCFRGSTRRFEITSEIGSKNEQQMEEVRSTRLQLDGKVSKSNTAIAPSESFDWRRQQHQQQLSAALNNTRSTAASPSVGHAVILNGIARKSHIIVQKCNSSGRLSVSLEDFTCSLDDVEGSGGYVVTQQQQTPVHQRHHRREQSSPPLPRTPRPRLSQERPTDESSRSALMRRNSLPKQLMLQGLEEVPPRRGTPLAAFQSSQHNRSMGDSLDQPGSQPGSSSTMPRVNNNDRELAPTSAIRLVNHSRIVTPPSSSSASASAASPPTSSSSAMSPSPLPLSNPGVRSVNNRPQLNIGSGTGRQQQPLPPPPPEPAVCFLPAYRTASLDTASPISIVGVQERALPPPPPPPKPRQLLARYNQFNQQVKVVKFCDETTEIPHDDEMCALENAGRQLPPSPPMESSPPPPHRMPQGPSSNLTPRPGVMTSWSKVAIMCENTTTTPTPTSPKKGSVGCSRVTGI